MLKSNCFAAAISQIPAIHFGSLLEFKLPFDNDEKLIEVQLIKYNPELYELAYNTYLQSKNIRKAYVVASAAVAQLGDNKLWRERLAKVATWSQEPMVALEQYNYLYQHYSDRTAWQKGFDLAKIMHDDGILVKFILDDIQSGNNTEKNWQAYTDLMLRLGNIDQLMQVLNTNQTKISLAFHLETLSKIYQILDEPKKQLPILQQLSALIGMKPEIAEQIADIYLHERKVKEASEVVSQARRQGVANDARFWNFDAQIAYLSENNQDELQAYQQLKKEKKPEVGTYTRLVELTSKSAPRQAFAYASEGLELYPNNYTLITDSFALIASSNLCLDFPKVLAKTSVSIRKKLNYDINYWNARVSYWQKLGNDREVLKSYLKGISYLPMYDDLKASLLYFLIEHNERMPLQQALSLWQNDLPLKPSLWAPAAQAYAKLDQPGQSKLILSLFNSQLEQYHPNPYWLIFFKDVLENANQPKEAARISHYAWPVYLNLLRKQKEPIDYTQLVDYIKLSMTEAPGDPTAIGLAKLQFYVNKDVELLLMSWAFSRHNNALAYAIYWSYLSRGIKPPLWISLSMAINRHDRTLMRKILTNRKAVINNKDRLTAAMEIDAIPLAQTLAYKELRRNRKDSKFYDNTFTPLMLNKSDDFYFDQEYYQYGSVAGPRTMVSYTYFWRPSVSLMSYNSIWITRNLPTQSNLRGSRENNNTPSSSNNINQVLSMVPHYDERAGIKIERQQPIGSFIVDLGYRRDLNGFMTAKVMRKLTLKNEFTITGTLGYHQPADDTAGLLVGGMRNNLELEFNYNLFPNDTVAGHFKQNSFFTQGREYLATGSQLTMRYEHMLWKRFPDWVIAPYGVIANYYKKYRGLLTGSILQIVPKTVTPTVNFLIPANFTEYGLNLSLGQGYIETYSHDWHPFCSFTISQNSVVGVGKLVNFGLAGSVIGRDHLLFYYEWGSNQGQGIQAEKLIKLSYRIYS